MNNAARGPARVLFVFVDGLGLGARDPSVNPVAAPRPGLARLSAGEPWIRGTRVLEDERVFAPIDPNLGMDGLPQSGTGQATLFTGVNCAKLAGRHYGPFPHSSSRQTLREKSIFARLGPAHCAFANAFPPRFFEVMKARDRRPTTTRACLDAGVRIRTLDDLRAGRAIAADLTGAGLRDMGLEVPVRAPAETARHALALAAEHRFTLVEIFHTDKAGHAQDRQRADAVLDDLSTFVSALDVERPPGLLLVLTSDHGNIEDLSVRTHTRNPVPLAASGPGAGVLGDVSDLSDVTPRLAALLGG